MDKITHEMRMEHWSALLQACYQSGLSKRVWCQQNDVNEKQFYYWQRQLRKQAYELQPVAKRQPAVFAQVQPCVADDHTVTALSNAIIRKGNLSVEISDDTSTELLLRILGALSHA